MFLRSVNQVKATQMRKTLALLPIILLVCTITGMANAQDSVTYQCPNNVNSHITHEELLYNAILAELSYKTARTRAYNRSVAFKCPTDTISTMF